MRWRSICGGVMSAALAVTGVAQQPQSEPKQRPKVALVLEGGAALGLAHIGVIQWLEEHHIPVDYVAGTSMGGLMGGMYSLGYSPAQMREFVSNIDWNEVLRGEIAYRDLSYRRKEDRRDYPNMMEFGLKNGGARFPEGLNAGQQAGFIFERVALPYSDVKSFDELPIPFACVGTDLASGKEFVFRNGSLVTAMRATMSLPGIFAPVKSDGHLFADGGLLNNLPTDVAKSMGADIVIAVHLQVKPFDPRAPIDTFSVAGRSIDLMINQNEIRGMEKADILITVDTSLFTAMDYQLSDKLIQKGYEAAAAKAAILKALSVDDSTWKSLLATRMARRRETPVPSFVEVTGVKSATAQDVSNRLIDNVGHPIDTGKLETQLTRINGTGRYSTLDYQLTERDGRTGLEIKANPKSYGPPFVRPLLIIDGTDYKNVLFKVGARITFMDLGGYGSEWRNDIIVGSEYGISSEFFRPFGRWRKWFIAPQGVADADSVHFYSGEDLVAQFRELHAGGGLDSGYSFNRFAELRLGYQGYYENFVPEVGNAAILPALSGRVGASRLLFNYLGLDDPVIPREGTAFQGRMQYFDASPGASKMFPLFEGKTWLFRRTGEPASVFLLGSGGTTFGHSSTGLTQFWLGGPATLPAYGENELLTNQYMLFRAGYLRRVVTLPPLLGDKVYLAGSYDFAKVYLPSGESRLPNDFMGTLMLNTFIGPIAIGGSVGDSGHGRFYFELGRIF